MSPSGPQETTQDSARSSLPSEQGDDFSELATMVATGGASGRAPMGRGRAVGRYLLLDRLGHGAMGEVFSAYDPDLDRRIAVKVLFGDAHGDSSEQEHRLQEAKAMARIDHPNVVRVYDAGLYEGAVFIAMELVEGPTLRKWLQSDRTRDEILDVFIGTARGLAAAHAAGVVHQDFKPANVLVARGAHPKVGDFGLAGIEELLTESTPQVEQSHMVGTPAYMSPEHFDGQGTGPRSDQFSFAVALAEALFGSRPFRGEHYVELASAVLGGELEPEHASRRGRIGALIRRALRADPGQRFASMTELVTALERIRRPSWPRWAIAGVTAAGLATATLWPSEEVVGCPPGGALVGGLEGSSVQVTGAEFTRAHLRQTKAYLEQAIEGYAARWSEAFDEHCAAAGPEPRTLRPDQRAAIECLDNRLGSLRGLVAFAEAEPLEASRVAPLLDTLPSLDDCISGGWVPYPADPERAARAAAVDEQIVEVRRARVADRLSGLDERSAAMLVDARALGEPFQLAHALTERARVLTTLAQLEDSRSLFREALEVSVAAGHDTLASRVVNGMILQLGSEPEPSWDEAKHLEALARGLVSRAGGNDEVLGFVAMNLAAILRKLERYDEAMRYDRLAVAHHRRTGDRGNIARARLNELVSLLLYGELEVVREQIGEAALELERSLGETSTEAMTARRDEVAVLSYLGRSRAAFERASKLFERARQHYQPDSDTYEHARATLSLTARNAGELDVAQSVLPEPTPSNEDSSILLDISRGLRDGMIARLEVASERARGQDWWLYRVELARVHYLRGEPEQAAEVLHDPRVVDVEFYPLAEELQAVTVLLAAVTQTPPPGEQPWAALMFPEPPRFRPAVRFLSAAQAVAVDDPTEVSRLRDELATMYYPEHPNVWLLDTWLERRAGSRATRRPAVTRRPPMTRRPTEIR